MVDAIMRYTDVNFFFFFQAEDGIRDLTVTGVQTCALPISDRLDYLAPLSNNVAYALAVEKLMDWDVPPRGKAIRTICCETSRISSHLLGIGAMALDLGAMTVFLYTFTEREKLYDLFELLTGARFTTSYTRVGGQIR